MNAPRTRTNVEGSAPKKAPLSSTARTIRALDISVAQEKKLGETTLKISSETQIAIAHLTKVGAELRQISTDDIKLISSTQLPSLAQASDFLQKQMTKANKDVQSILQPDLKDIKGKLEEIRVTSKNVLTESERLTDLRLTGLKEQYKTPNIPKAAELARNIHNNIPHLIKQSEQVINHLTSLENKIHLLGDKVEPSMGSVADKMELKNGLGAILRRP